MARGDKDWIGVTDDIDPLEKALREALKRLPTSD